MDGIDEDEDEVLLVDAEVMVMMVVTNVVDDEPVLSGIVAEELLEALTGLMMLLLAPEVVAAV